MAATGSLLRTVVAEGDAENTKNGSPEKADDYKARLVRLIPAETVALYTGLAGLPESLLQTIPACCWPALIVVFLAGFVGTPPILNRAYGITWKYKKGQIVITMAAYVLYVASIGPFQGFNSVLVRDETPRITVLSPQHNTQYELKEAVQAVYYCESDPISKRPRVCQATASGGKIVAYGDAIDTSSVGVKTLTITAEDGDEKKTEVVDYEVVHRTAPVLSGVPGDLELNSTSHRGARLQFTVTATDSDPAEPEVTCNAPSNFTFPIGTTEVKCSATDGAGNKAEESFTVTVNDTTPPTLKIPEEPLILEAEDPSGTEAHYKDWVQAADFDPAEPEVTYNPPSGSTFQVGKHTIECSAEDTAGHKATGSFEVIVQPKT